MASELTKNFESFLDNNTPGGYVQTSISISDDNLNDRINEVLNTKGYLNSNSHLPWNQIDNKPAGTYITNINNLTGSSISITGSNIAVNSNDNTTIAAAINNLNTAINGITGDIGDVTIGDENIIESISVNGNNIQPDNNKNINITVPIVDDEFDEESNNALSSIGLYNLLKQCCYPTIYQQPQTQYVRPNTEVTLTCIAKGYNLRYQWQKTTFENHTYTTIDIDDEEDYTYSFQPTTIDFNSNTSYNCKIIDGFNNIILSDEIYIAKIIYINFNANGGMGDMEQLDIIEEQDFILPECTFTYDNKNFQYWSTDTNGETIYQVGETIFPDDDILLYAIWA